jgi:hypothetical protein
MPSILRAALIKTTIDKLSSSAEAQLHRSPIPRLPMTASSAHFTAARRATPLHLRPYKIKKGHLRGAEMAVELGWS